MPFPEWGNIPAWVSTGSFFIAAMAYRRSVMDKERDQASKVSAWVGSLTDNGRSKRVLRVANTSDAAVYDLFIKPEGSDSILLPELPAKDSRSFDLRGDPPAAKERSSRTRLRITGVPIVVRSISSEALLEAPPVIEFCDAAGRWWRRSSRRQVRRIRRRTVKTLNTEFINKGRRTVSVDGVIIEPMTIIRQNTEPSPSGESE
jgi:hypothetical protein